MADQPGKERGDVGVMAAAEYQIGAEIGDQLLEAGQFLSGFGVNLKRGRGGCDAW